MFGSFLKHINKKNGWVTKPPWRQQHKQSWFFLNNHSTLNVMHIRGDVEACINCARHCSKSVCAEDPYFWLSYKLVQQKPDNRRSIMSSKRLFLLSFRATSCFVHFESSRQVVNINQRSRSRSTFVLFKSSENCWQFKWCWLWLAVDWQSYLHQLTLTRT